MNKHLPTFTLSLVMLLGASATAQVRVEGSLIDRQSAEGIPFATVVLRSAADTTAAPVGTITDLNGRYSLTLPAGEYRLEASCLGYMPLHALRQVDGELVQWADSLRPDAQQIDEVRVTASYGRTANRKAYTFSPAEVRQAQQGHDLLQHLPMVMADPSGALRGTGGKSVLLLVNGSTATDNDVRMLPPKTIKRVDVYDIPPSRYQGMADYVINVITTELDNGTTGGFSIDHALLTTYGTDRAYLSLVRNHHKLSLDYDLSLYDFNNCPNSTELSYTLNGIDHSQTISSTERSARTEHKPRLKYAYVDLDRRIVELSLKPNFASRSSRQAGTGSYEQDDGAYSEALKQASIDQERTMNPSADLYYWRKLGEADELALNVAAAHFDTERGHREHERRTNDGATMFADTFDLHNTKTSVIAELSYARTLRFGRWETGYRAQQSWLNSYYSNSFGRSRYTNAQLQQYVHTELSGATGKWLYSLSLGATHIRSAHNVSSQVQHQLLFAPRAVLGYGRVRLMYQFFPEHPDVADLSNNATYLSRHIVSRGNPDLQSNNLHSLHATVSVAENPYITLELVPQGGYGKNTIVKRFREVNGMYELQGINARSERIAGLGLWSLVRPFGDNTLEIDISAAPLYTEIDWDGGSGSIFSMVNSLGMNLNIKQFTLKYWLSFSETALSYDGYKKSNNYDRGFSELTAHYQLEGWRFSAGLLWAGMAPTIRTEMLSPTPVRYVSERTMGNARNMLTLGVAYHFGRGKDWEYDRALENSDTAVPNQ